MTAGQWVGVIIGTLVLGAVAGRALTTPRRPR